MKRWLLRLVFASMGAMVQMTMDRPAVAGDDAGQDDGPKIIAHAAYGYGNQAQSLGIYTNQSPSSVEDGCALGGFGRHIESRSYVASTDQVGTCRKFSMFLPVAVLHYASKGGSDLSFADDGNTGIPQEKFAAFGAAPTAEFSHRKAVATIIALSKPLSVHQLSRLRRNMFVQTSTGWSAVLTSWDPKGRWVAIDAWCNIIVGPSTVAYVGYDPRALNVDPEGGKVGSLTLTIGANNNGYGGNSIVEMPKDVYCLFGVSCQVEGDEITLLNNGRPFVRNEFRWFGDSPRNIGVLVGSQGPYGNSAGYAVAGGRWDKGFVASEGQYAGFLVAPFGDYGMGDGFMSQQTHGNAFSIRNSGGYVYTVDSDGNLVTRGSVTSSGPLVRGRMYQEALLTPPSSSAPCDAGQFTDDANYHYVCVSRNRWKRASLQSW
jgi:hypothetical protein